MSWPRNTSSTAPRPPRRFDQQPLPTLPPNPAKPVPLKITVQDISSQKLVRHAADRPRGLLCALDEMASWVEKVCDPRSGDDRSAWTVAYESGRYEMDRVGTGTTRRQLCCGVFGNLQPRVLRENFKALSKDGLVQRFIPVNIRPEMRKLGHPVPEYMTNSAEYDQAIRVCFGLPPMTYRLSGAAYDTYREFQRWYERAMRMSASSRARRPCRRPWARWRVCVGRIALVWHCIEAPYSLEVSEPPDAPCRGVRDPVRDPEPAVHVRWGLWWRRGAGEVVRRVRAAVRGRALVHPGVS